MKASLGLCRGAQVGSFGEGGFAQPSSAPVTASACERFIFYPVWGLEIGLLRSLKYSQKWRHRGSFLRSLACPWERPWCQKQVPDQLYHWAAEETVWRLISNIITGCIFSKVLNFKSMYLTVIFITLHLWIEMWLMSTRTTYCQNPILVLQVFIDKSNLEAIFCMLNLVSLLIFCLMCWL